MLLTQSSKTLFSDENLVTLLRAEGRASVLDFGAGPGHDGRAFLDDGLWFVGVDVAHGNGVLAAARDVHVLQGSMVAPPIRPRAFDAGWSMSTLMHIPEREVPQVVESMAQTLQAGAPFLVGLWGGGRGGDHIDEAIEGERRLFSQRNIHRRCRCARRGLGRSECGGRSDRRQQHQPHHQSTSDRGTRRATAAGHHLGGEGPGEGKTKEVHGERQDAGTKKIPQPSDHNQDLTPEKPPQGSERARHSEEGRTLAPPIP